METINIVLQVIVPIYMLILVGYLSRKAGLFGKDSLKEMNKGVFRLFLPALLFENMYNADLSVDDAGVVIYALLTVFVIFVICCLTVPLIEKNRAKAPTIIQGIYRTNFGLLGIALTESCYGKDGTHITVMIVAIVIPVYNALAVILFEKYKDRAKVSYKSILAGVMKNPLILGTVLGLIVNLSGLRVPEIPNRGISSLGQIATPLALIVMGASFEVRHTIENRKVISAVTFVRLLIIPLLFTMAAVMAGFRGKELYGLFIMYATPTAVASYTMAGNMGGDEKLAGEIVFTTTVLSAVTIGTGVYLLSKAGLI